MELRQIEYFLAVVEHGGIGGASVSLGVTQPTVSQALRALERELGVQLFHRIGRGMVPSAAGRALVGSARQIVRDVESVDEVHELISSLPMFAFMDITINRKNQTHQIIKNRANQEIHHESCGIGLWFMDAGYH